MTHQTAYSIGREPCGGTIRLLASVLSAKEACAAVAAGVDIVDAKDPARGALGALDSATLQAIRAVVPHTLPLSATTGDIAASETTQIVNEVERIAATGVDLVKVGFFGVADFAPLLDVLSACKGSSYAFGRRVGVVIADQVLDWSFLAQLPAAGFSGVMLDTATKSSGALLDIVSRPKIDAFVGDARRVGMFAGLAGALRLRHIPEAIAIGPDVVGLRGALCRGLDRTLGIDGDAIREVRALLHGAGTQEKGAAIAQLPE